MNLSKENDENLMRLALKEAEKAYQLNEVPIGAIIVSPKQNVIGSGYNLVETHFSQTEHAEARAIKKAGKKMNDWRLNSCTIYVTLQPCVMCLGLICLSRVSRIVFAATSDIFSCNIDKELLPEYYKKHIKGITSGVLKEEALTLLKNFFNKKRKESG